MAAADIAHALGDARREGRRLARSFSLGAHPAIKNYGSTRASPPPGMKLVNPFVLFRQQNGGHRMTSRERLPNRRAAETFALQAAEQRCLCTIGRFGDGRLAEIFLSNDNAGSHADAWARDSAVICSIALQHGVPVDVLARALLRDSSGRPETPLGVALAYIVKTEEEGR
jgi:hypothetical protein